MEVSQMRDLILQCAGIAGIAVALIHGVLGETKVFAKATIEPERLRTLIRLVWQAGTVAWIGGGVLLIAAPSMGSESARRVGRARGGGILAGEFQVVIPGLRQEAHPGMT